MQVSIESLRVLRDRTGAGIMDSKRALEAAGGDVDKAEAALREQGIARAATKSDRETTEGMVDCYVHAGSRIGAMVEIDCETDFVARTPEFTALAPAIAMQVAAMSLVLDGRARVGENIRGRRFARFGLGE